MKKKIIPAGRRILIELDEVEEKSSGGILLPTETLEREGLGEYEAVVLALGTEAFKDINDGYHWCNVGDRILFRAYSGVSVDRETKDRRRLINDLDVMAIIEEDTDG